MGLFKTTYEVKITLNCKTKNQLFDVTTGEGIKPLIDQERISIWYGWGSKPDKFEVERYPHSDGWPLRFMHDYIRNEIILPDGDNIGYPVNGITKMEYRGENAVVVILTDTIIR